MYGVAGTRAAPSAGTHQGPVRAQEGSRKSAEALPASETTGRKSSAGSESAKTCRELAAHIRGIRLPCACGTGETWFLDAGTCVMH